MQFSQSLKRLKNISDRRYTTSLTALFLLVGTITASHHEMWRDEIQTWLLARDSSSLTDLFRNLEYQGHPGLWPVYLLPLTRITRSPVIMQVFHLLIAATTVYLFVRCSPFTRIQKFLFAFGYFSLYEYSVVCRNYALGVLLLCLFCILFQQRYARFLLVSIVLFLLGHTSVHALIIAIVTGFVLMLDYLLDRRRILAEGAINEWQIWVGFGLIALGVLTAMLQLTPPADSGFAVGWYTSYDADHLKSVIKTIARAFFPVPQAKFDFWWSSPLLETYPVFIKMQLSLSLLVVAWFSLVLLQKPIALSIYLLGTIGLLSFFYVKYFGSIRHHGFLFMLFIAVAWIYRYCGEANRPTLINRFSFTREELLRPILTLILIFHFIGGIIAVCMDYRYVFSYGKAAAAFIKEHDMQEMLMVGEADYAVSTIVGYLGKDQVYYPRGDRFGSFVIWDEARTREVSDDQIIQKAKELGAAHVKNVLIILNHALSPDLISYNSLTELATFTGSTVGDEGFYLYLLRTL